MKILFSDEKYFDIDGVYNSQNYRGWAINRADEKGGIKQRLKHLPSSNGVAKCLFPEHNVPGNLQ